MNDEALQALALSAQVAAVAMLLCALPALMLAWVLARKRFAGKWLLEATVQLPMVLPPVVPGYALLWLFGRNGPAGRVLDTWGVHLVFTWQGAALAAAVMALPLVVQPLRLAFSLIDPRVEAMAQSLGARPWQAWWRVSLPLALPGLIAGLVLGFCRALGEFGATMAFVGNIPGETRTLALAIYSASHLPGEDATAWRLIALSVGISIAAIAGSQWLTGYWARRAGAESRHAGD